MTVPVIIIGAGGHAKVLIYSLNALRHEIIGIFHPGTTLIGRSIAGIRVIGNDDKLLEYAPDSIELVNGIGSIASTEKRKNIFMKFKNNGYSFATVVHPSAIVMSDVQLGEGVQIMAGAIIQPGCRIGDNVIINTGAILDHDCIIGEHTHIAPGVVLSGGVHIGVASHVGTSAAVIQGIKIGENAVIGAGAVVIKNIPACSKAMGVPARIVK
jgi:UDP-perosamine 4-acetyltransferase